MEPGNIPSTGRFHYSLAELFGLIVAVAALCRWPPLISLLAPLMACYVAGKSPGSSLRGPRWLYRVMLPGVWLTAAIASWRHPGDEYGMFGVCALPACWILPFVHFQNLREALPLIFPAGAISVALIGYAMDRLRIRSIVFFPVFLTAAIGLTLASVLSYPSYQRAISKNGSLTAYIACATCLGLYLSAVVTLLAAAFFRTARAFYRRFRGMAMWP